MAKKYYNKILELEELKKLQIEKRQNSIYDIELSALKDKQRDIYNDLLLNYDTKREELELKYQNKIEITKKNKIEEKKSIKKINSKNNNKLINKKILILEDKKKKILKMRLYNKAEEIKNEIEKEKILLNKQKEKEKKKIDIIKINNLKKRQNKKMDEILLKYNKEKNDLEITFNKERNELIQKFKIQLNEFEMFKKKDNKKNKKIYIPINSNNTFNESFDKNIISKKLEDDEESI